MDRGVWRAIFHGVSRVRHKGVTKHVYALGLPMCVCGKESPVNAGDMVSPLGQEDPLEKELATHSSILA